MAYTRIFGPGDYFSAASIGRVVVRDDERKYGYGRDIMEASIKAVLAHFGETEIQVSAQAHLEKFYNSLEFMAFGEGVFGGWHPAHRDETSQAGQKLILEYRDAPIFLHNSDHKGIAH